MAWAMASLAQIKVPTLRCRYCRLASVLFICVEMTFGTILFWFPHKKNGNVKIIIRSRRAQSIHITRKSQRALISLPQPGFCVVDPMCGVGTILIEAAQEHKVRMTPADLLYV